MYLIQWCTYTSISGTYLADHQKWNFSSQIIVLFVKTFKMINAYKWINVKL